MPLFRPLTVAGLVLLASAFARAEPREIRNLVVDGVPEIPAALAERLNQYQNTRSATLQGWFGDGMLITTRFAETSQVHLVKTPLGARRQLTFFGEPILSASVPPGAEPQSFLFAKDIGGSEFYQLFQFGIDNGASALLTDGKSRNGGALWSNKGDRFAYFTTKRNGRDYDIYVASAAAPAEGKLVYQGEGSWSALDWSPDDSKLLLMEFVSANESYLYILDLASGALEPINPKESEKISYGAAKWGADGKTVFLTSDEGSEFIRLLEYDLATKSLKSLTEDIDWNVAELEIDPARRRLAFTVNEDGLDALYLFDSAGGARKEIGALPRGQIGGLHFNAAGDKLGFTANASTTPGDSISVELERRTFTRWTESEVGGLNPESFIQPELIHYPTFDAANGKARQIPAFFYKPKRIRKVPVVIHIHGGPESQYVPGFNPAFQFYLNELGVAVVAPNVRGSEGYGKSYLKLDNGELREDSVKDIGALLDWIAARPDLDASRVAVMGGSYGGYMTYACMARYNDRLRCGLASVGIGNFVTFLENTQAYRRDLRRAEYGDERDPKMRKFLESISPTTNAAKIAKPMLIAQGANDPRVPASESEAIAAAIRKNGVPVWTILAKDEGHGFAKKANRDYHLAAQALFMQEFLLK